MPRKSSAYLAAMAALFAAAPALAAPYFDRVASFPITPNLPAGIDRGPRPWPRSSRRARTGWASRLHGRSAKAIGFIDIADPASPGTSGAALAVGGEPTSVKVVGGRGLRGGQHLRELRQARRQAPRRQPGPNGRSRRNAVSPGQPDSVLGQRGIMAIAIENERDESVNDGALPQMPAGSLVVAPVVDGTVACRPSGPST